MGTITGRYVTNLTKLFDIAKISDFFCKNPKQNIRWLTEIGLIINAAQGAGSDE